MNTCAGMCVDTCVDMCGHVSGDVCRGWWLDLRHDTDDQWHVQGVGCADHLGRRLSQQLAVYDAECSLCLDMC